MLCKNCGKELPAGSDFCPHCGNPCAAPKDIVEIAKRLSVWGRIAIGSFLAALITLGVGIAKLSNGHAYVGGDAYNYLINSSQATAFFVLTTMFALLGVGFLILHFQRNPPEKK